VLAVGRRRNDPRHRGQGAVADVFTEGFQKALRHGVAEALGQRAERVVDGRVVERPRGSHRLRDVGGRHIHRAAALGHLLDGGAPMAKAHHLVAAEVVDQALVHLPFHAGLLEPVGIGGPGPAFGGCADVVAGVELVVQHRQLHLAPVDGADAVGPVGATPVEQPVRDGAGVHAAVVVVAQREGLGQRPLERHFRGVVVAHRQQVLDVRPLVHAAVVPGGLRVGPAVRRAARALRVALVLVEAVGRVRGGRRGLGVGLVKDGLAVGRGHGKAVAVAAHALEGAEVAVERTVLLHQQHDVLHVLDGTGLVVSGNGQRAANAGRKSGQRGGCNARAGGALKKLATCRGHVVSVFLPCRHACPKAGCRGDFQRTKQL
jgi:hypothetical protein